MENYVQVTITSGLIWCVVWLFVVFVAVCFFNLVMRVVEYIYMKERDEPIIRGWQTITDRNDFDKLLRESVPDETHRLAYSSYLEGQLPKRDEKSKIEIKQIKNEK